MTKGGQTKYAVWLLRAGLAFVFLYAAISSLVTPSDWIGYLPHVVRDNFNGDLLLKLFSVGQIGLALWLLSGKFVKYAAWLSALLLAGIVVTNPKLLSITFRDIGLLATALALAFLETD